MLHIDTYNHNHKELLIIYSLFRRRILGVLLGECYELFKVDQGNNQVGFTIVTFTHITQSTTARLTL
jgi:hypothetical protein